MHRYPDREQHVVWFRQTIYPDSPPSASFEESVDASLLPSPPVVLPTTTATTTAHAITPITAAAMIHSLTVVSLLRAEKPLVAPFISGAGAASFIVRSSSGACRSRRTLRSDCYGRVVDGVRHLCCHDETVCQATATAGAEVAGSNVAILSLDTADMMSRRVRPGTLFVHVCSSPSKPCVPLMMMFSCMRAAHKLLLPCRAPQNASRGTSCFICPFSAPMVSL